MSNNTVPGSADTYVSAGEAFADLAFEQFTPPANTHNVIPQPADKSKDSNTHTEIEQPAKQSLFAKLKALYTDQSIDDWIKSNPEKYISVEDAFLEIVDPIREKGVEFEVTAHKDVLKSLQLLSEPETFIPLTRELQQIISEEIKKLSTNRGLSQPEKRSTVGSLSEFIATKKIEDKIKSLRRDLDSLRFIEAFSTGDLTPYAISISTLIDKAIEAEQPNWLPTEYLTKVTTAIGGSKKKLFTNYIILNLLNRPGHESFSNLHSALTSENSKKLFADKRFLMTAALSMGGNVAISNAAMVALPAMLVKLGKPELALTYMLLEGFATTIPILPGLPGYVRLVTYGIIEGILSYSTKGKELPNYNLLDSIKHGILPAVDLGWMTIPLTSALRRIGVQANNNTLRALITALNIGYPVVRLSKKYGLEK